MQVLARSRLSTSQRKSLIEPINRFFDVWVSEYGDEYVYSEDVLKNDAIKTAFEQMDLGEFEHKSLMKFMKVHKHYKYYNYEIRGHGMSIGRGYYWAVKTHWNVKESFK